MNGCIDDDGGIIVQGRVRGAINAANAPVVYCKANDRDERGPSGLHLGVCSLQLPLVKGSKGN